MTRLEKLYANIRRNPPNMKGEVDGMPFKAVGDGMMFTFGKIKVSFCPCANNYKIYTVRVYHEDTGKQYHIERYELTKQSWNLIPQIAHYWEAWAVDRGFYELPRYKRTI
jgi:hypothetical protein